jgi:RNA polymerase sigma-70 factor, ECF subfamily
MPETPVRLHSVPAPVERLYLAYQPQVLRYLTRMLGQRETAQDLTQETFLRATRAQAPGEEPHQRAWLFHIARNLALNHMRDTSRHRDLQSDAPPVNIGSGPDTALIVNEALGRLSTLDRDVFVLRESAGLSYDEIAAACEITSDAVRSRLQRARQALRIMLQDVLVTERGRGVRFSGRKTE